MTNYNSTKWYKFFGWLLYDFTNSIAVVIGGIYFSKWFIENLHASSILFNSLFLLAAIVILILGKPIGKNIDKRGYKSWLTLSSIISGACLFLLYAISKIELPTDVIIGLSFPVFLFFLLSYQVSRICHNSYFKKIIPEILQSRMSGYGTVANWAGSLFGILITIPVITAYQVEEARELTFLIAAISFALLCPVAVYLMFKNKQAREYPKLKTPIPLKRRFRDLLPVFSLTFFVYFLLFDVMSTVQRNLPPFLSNVHLLNDKTQSIGFLIILLLAMLGGFFAAYIVNAKNSRNWLKIGTALLSIALLFVTVSNNITVWCAFIIAGFSYGILESTIRVHFAQSFSEKEAGEKFGQLAAVERASGLFGPLFWIIPFSLFELEKTSNIVAMGFLLLLTLIAFSLIFIMKETVNE